MNYGTRKLLMVVFGFLLAGLGIAQPKEGEGAFNIKTGEQLSFEAWMSLIPEELDLFGEQEVFSITLESDFKRFIREKDKDKNQPAYLYFPLNDSIEIKRQIRIKPRGNNRKNTCSTPPIKLNFKKTELYVKHIQRINKMKMVSECRGGSQYQGYVLREYLVYKLYNLFTDLSFKARLIEVTYVNTGTKKVKTSTGYAFLIEEVADLAKRNGMIQIKVETAAQKDIVDENMALFAMFQYMIGNTDWSIAQRHNTKLLKEMSAPQPKAHLIPYDFDYAGFVNASYAVPYEKFNLSSVRERLFRCQCFPEEVFQQTIDQFLDKKKDVYQIIANFDLVNTSTKDDLTYYIDQFYSQIEKEQSVQYFLKNCGQFL